MNEKTTLFSVIKNYKALVFGLFLLSVLVSATSLVFPKLISHAIDTVIDTNTLPKDTLVLFCFLVLVVLLISYLQNYLQAETSEKVAFDMRAQLIEKLASQSYESLDGIEKNILLTNVTSDVDNVKTFISQVSIMLLTSVIMIIGAAFLLFSTDAKLATYVVLLLPLLGIAFFLIFRGVRKLFLKSREVIDVLNRVIGENVAGATLVRVLDSKKVEIKKFAGANTDARDIGVAIVKMFSALIPTITLITSLTSVVILYVGGEMVILDQMSIGDLTAFYSYVALLIFPIIMLSFTANMIAQADASFKRIIDVFNKEDFEKNVGTKEGILGNISFQNVSLVKDGTDILKNITLEIKQNSRVAIVGPTASGKSQILYLFLGLIKPTSGTILYDGKGIEEYNTDYFYNSVSLVFQESILFNSTLCENILFSASNISDLEIQTIIETAELDDFIKSLPEGLDTMITERGSNLSGGQKQRIMLARALANKPKILFLDDFTARVDAVTEEKILQNLNKHYPNITLISVTQKIEPIKKYDQIIVLMEGEVIGVGTHEELLKNSLEYMQIVESQKSTQSYEL